MEEASGAPFDVSTAKHLDEEQLLRVLDYKLSDYESLYGISCSVDKTDVNARLEILVKEAFEQTGSKVVLIIDEYDAPLLDVMNNRENLSSLQ